MFEYIFIEKCRGCGEFVQPAHDEPKTACTECWETVVSEPPLIERCSLAGEQLQIVSGCPYSGIIKKLIYKFKYDDDALIADDLVTLLLKGWTELRQLIPVGSDVVLIPVPLHWTRKLKRGFNQAEVLVRGLAGALKRSAPVRIDCKALKRSRATKAHHGLGRAERLTNVEQAFVADGVPGRAGTATPTVAVIVDDIYTSGATMVACAQALRNAGWSHVCGLTVARAMDD